MSQIEAVGWQRLPETGHFWIYVPVRSVAQGGQGVPGEGLPEPDVEHPLLQSYIDVVIEGGLEYGEEFAREIVETTDGWSRSWLNDRELARRPTSRPARSARLGFDDHQSTLLGRDRRNTPLTGVGRRKRRNPSRRGPRKSRTDL
jgi:hypothetical protein